MSIYGPRQEKKITTTLDTGNVDLSDYVRKTGVRMTGRINMNNKKITNLGTATEATDAVTLGEVRVLTTYLNDNKVSKSGDYMTGPLDMREQKIENVGTPTSDKDVVTKKYVDDMIQHEHDVSVHALGRYIVIPNEGTRTKAYFSVRAKKNINLDQGIVVEVKNGTSNDDNGFSIENIPDEVVPPAGRDLAIMTPRQPMRIFFNRNAINEPWNLCLIAKLAPTFNILFTFQVNDSSFFYLKINRINNGIIYSIEDGNGQFHSQTIPLDTNQLNHISIELVENKVCFWVNGHMQAHSYKTQALVSLVEILVNVKELGILSFYNRHLTKQEIIQHFIDYYVENFTDDEILI